MIRCLVEFCLTDWWLRIHYDSMIYIVCEPDLESKSGLGGDIEGFGHFSKGCASKYDLQKLMVHDGST